VIEDRDFHQRPADRRSTRSLVRRVGPDGRKRRRGL
jgi:hypothetical protein